MDDCRLPIVDWNSDVDAGAFLIVNQQSSIENRQSLAPHFLFFKVPVTLSTRNFL